jgi:hypothetical protein
MKPSTFLACALALATPATWARSVDAKALARYDGSYVVCEATFPEMRGHRDEAYLSLWRAKADAANRAQLADVRKGAVYRAERVRLAQTSAKASAAASSPIKQQCQALWGEAQRTLNANATKR